MIVNVASRGDWHTESVWGADYVANHIDELVQVLTILIATQLGAAKVVQQVSTFLQDLFMERRSYAHLHHFKNVFHNLVGLMMAPHHSSSHRH